MSEYLTSKEFADLLRISEAMVRKMRCQRTGPTPLKVGARVIYERSEVQRWIRAQYPRASMMPACRRDDMEGLVAA